MFPSTQPRPHSCPRAGEAGAPQAARLPLGAHRPLLALLGRAASARGSPAPARRPGAAAALAPRGRARVSRPLHLLPAAACGLPAWAVRRPARRDLGISISPRVESRAGAGRRRRLGAAIGGEVGRVSSCPFAGFPRGRDPAPGNQGCRPLPSNPRPHPPSRPPASSPPRVRVRPALHGTREGAARAQRGRELGAMGGSHSLTPKGRELAGERPPRPREAA